MPRPRQRSRAETLLMKELDNWKTKVCVLRRELETKQSYADKLTYLLRQRSERIDELNSKLAQVREQNRRLDQENEHLAEMIRFTPKLDAAMLRIAK
jgi:hypothetical protein